MRTKWDDSYAKPYESLREKIWELISRADGLPNNLAPQEDPKP
jgi:hypothetical protein